MVEVALYVFPIVDQVVVADVHAVNQFPYVVAPILRVGHALSAALHPVAGGLPVYICVRLL